MVDSGRGIAVLAAGTIWFRPGDARAGLPGILIYLGEILLTEALLGFLKSAFKLDVQTWVGEQLGTARGREYFPPNQTVGSLHSVAGAEARRLTGFNSGGCRCGCAGDACCILTLTSGAGMKLQNAAGVGDLITTDHVAVLTACAAGWMRNHADCATRMLGAPTGPGYHYESCRCHNYLTSCTCSGGTDCGCPHRMATFQTFEHGTIHCVALGPDTFRGQVYLGWQKASPDASPPHDPFHTAEYRTFKSV